MRATLEERLWSRVAIPPDVLTSCWLWTGSLSEGYGQIACDGQMVRTHRVAFEQVNGPIPPGLCVCHRCDEPRCVNPAHLFLGTQAENLADMFSKGRQGPRGLSKGEMNGRARLTDEQVGEVRQRLAAGETQVELAQRFGVNQTTISRIKRGNTWA